MDLHHSRLQRHGCLRPANHGSSKCGGALACPSTLTHIVFSPDPLPCPQPGNISAALGVSPLMPSQKHLSSLLALALHAASTLSLPASYMSSESDCLHSFQFHHDHSCINGKTFHKLADFREVMAQELHRANSGSIWGAIWLLLAKCIFRLPPPRRIP